MGRISFQKRQKEMKRQEKRQMKEQKRAERKLAKNAGEVDPVGPSLESEDVSLVPDGHHSEEPR